VQPSDTTKSHQKFDLANGRFAPTAVIRQLAGPLIYPAKKLQAAVASVEQTFAIPKT
jgi:hypothetical protein